MAVALLQGPTPEPAQGSEPAVTKITGSELKWRSRGGAPQRLSVDLEAKPIVVRSITPSEPNRSSVEVRRVQAVEPVLAPFPDDNEAWPTTGSHGRMSRVDNCSQPDMSVLRSVQVPERPVPTPSFALPPDEAFNRPKPAGLDLDCDKEYSKLKAITAISDRIQASAGDFPPECPLMAQAYIPRDFCMPTYTWKASGLCHKPLYFEDASIERYGHSFGPFLQPFVSGAHFFVSAAMLPYQMGLELPTECVTPLGHYRPGSCAPYIVCGIPISARGALFQAGFVATCFWLIP